MSQEKSKPTGWHEGELQIQRRAGVSGVSSAGIRESIPDGAARFIEQQQFAAFSSADAQGAVWASLRLSPHGLFRVLDPLTVETGPIALPGDPLIDNLRGNPSVGVVVIDPSTRRRLRLNGDADVLPGEALRIHTRQLYGNCPQYIQERTLEGDGLRSKGALISRAKTLSSDQQQWVASTDTFFIASLHPTAGADASHRGGNPGFVHVVAPNRLLIPDYSGNRMFNTLGNISVNPRVGLAFPDFKAGRTLQLSGEATIHWEFDERAFPGAQRLLEFAVENAIETSYPILQSYVFRSYSDVNPPVTESSGV